MATISSSTVPSNPYNGVANSTATVSVQKWGSGNNDSLESILRNQGYSPKEIYSKDANGQRLLDRVSAVNDLRNPNLIRPGQELRVPSRAMPAEGVSNGNQGVAAQQGPNRNGNAADEPIQDGLGLGEKAGGLLDDAKGGIEHGAKLGGARLAKLAKYAKFAKPLGVFNLVAQPLITGMEIDDIRKDKTLSRAEKQEKVCEAVGSGVGSMAGGTIGAIVGGAVGAFGGPLGALVGTVVGGFVGDAIGGAIGGMVGKAFGSTDRQTSAAVAGGVAGLALGPAGVLLGSTVGSAIGSHSEGPSLGQRAGGAVLDTFDWAFGRPGSQDSRSCPA